MHMFRVVIDRNSAAGGSIGHTFGTARGTRHGTNSSTVSDVMPTTGLHSSGFASLVTRQELFNFLYKPTCIDTQDLVQTTGLHPPGLASPMLTLC